jgi:Ca2+-binding EF-hand superfamily protein
VEAGLKADFAAADTNHDGVLELDEVRAVNDKRWSVDASASSPLVDWNHDGVVDFDEFAATARSLFEQMDADGNGVLSPAELRPKGSGAGQGEKRGGDGGEQRGHGGRGGGRGGGGQGGGGDQGGPDQ